MDLDFKLQLAAGRVDPASGIIYDVTIAKSGVAALGKFIFVDRDGKRVLDPKQAVRKLPVYTDDRTLETLMGAFQDSGPRVKSRIDHNDAIEARAGWTENPRRVGNLVVGDLHLLQSFEARDIVLETAEKTPELIGMSIDMVPSFEIVGDRAFMRIEQLTAVDIVDEGAITPAGMFLNRGRVDNEHSTGNPVPIMPDKTQNPPQGPEVMEAAIKALTARCDAMDAAHKALEASHQELGAKHSALEAAHKELLGKHSALEAAHKTLSDGLAKPAPVPDVPTPGAMAAMRKEFADNLKVVRDEVVEMKKTATALGMRAAGTPGGDKPGTGPSADTTDAGSRDTTKPKDYLTLVAEKQKTDKLSASVAHQTVQRENPDAYRLHQEKLGVWPKQS